ncbi:MAG: rhodanese-like domain-containing protein [Sphingobacteriia bacterium]|nr:rhodanese-like domain-containing protein [Sphingobacteriia bacterium]
MKKITSLLFAFMLISAFVFTGCSDDDDDQPFNAQMAVADYLVSQNMDLNKMLDGFVMPAPDDGNVSGKYLIDIRASEDFAQGHIEGAVNVPFSDILTAAADADKPIVVVCYTGQTATYAVTLLRLSGYTDAQALKWGMSGWNPVFANHTKGWNGKTGDIAIGHENWTTDPAPSNLTYDSPTFTSTSTDPAEILSSRVSTVISEGFKTVTADDVLNNPESFFINNYFSEADYIGFGHIDGAYRIQPMLIGEGQINYNDAAKKVVTYCYTGQTSAAITAYMRVLGYDAYSMLFGMNKLYHSNSAWTANKWGDTVPKNLDYVTE